MNRTILNRTSGFLNRIAGIALVFSLAACNGSDNSATNSTAGTASGTVGILLTDKPADPALFLEINAVIESVILIADENSEDVQVTLYSGPTAAIDLLNLQHQSIPLTYTDDVPAGEYCKLRLVLSDLELVLADDTPNDSSDNETYHPALPGNGKLDMVMKDCLSVESGSISTLQVDLDAGNSIHINETGNGYIFRPVVFVDVIDGDFAPKLVRVSGTVANFNVSENSILLCDAVVVENMDSLGCVDVGLGDDAAFFDNLNASGAPRPFDELLVDTSLGQPATVVGLPHHRVAAYTDTEVPPGHYPPPGECRVWVIGVEPGQQEAPIDCDDVPSPLPEGTLLVTHDGPVADPYKPLMKVAAVVVELGEFLQLEGSVASNADASGFTMNLDDGSLIVSDTPLAVMLQQGGIGFNGTRIVTRTGELLDTSAVIVPRTLQVDGILESMSATELLLKAALVIVDTETSTDTQQLTGTVLNVGLGAFTLDPDADTVCGLATNDLTVTLDGIPEILTVVISDSGSLIETGGTLAAGQTVGMNGECSIGGYVTDNLVIIDDQRF